MKNFIYKTLMVAVMVSLILSMTSVNASAFEKEPGGYVDISGDQDEDDIFGSFSSIYSENYALINCGLLSEITFGGKTFSTNSVVLDDFLFQVNNRGFTSPNGLFTYVDDHVCEMRFVEFFFFDAVNNCFESFNNVLDCYNDRSVTYGNGLYVYRYSHLAFPTFRFNFESCYENYSNCFFIAALYFNDYTPFDDEFNSDVSSFVTRIEELERENHNLSVREDELRRQNGVLEQDVDRYKTAFENLRDTLGGAPEEIERLNKIIFDMKNANALDQVFTGTSNSMLMLIRGVSSLGYTVGNVNVTVGGLLVVTILAALVVFFIRLFTGKGG